MKQLHFSIMLSILLSIFVVQSYAHDIEVKNADGVTIYYVWTNNKAELAVSYRGSSFDNFSDEYIGNVVIPSSVIYKEKTYPVTSVSMKAFYGCTSLTSITIPNSVIYIKEYAFYHCKALKAVTIPNNVTSIDQAAFCGCSSLTSLTIGNSVTSIGLSAFSGCSKLTSIIIPNSVTTIGQDAFGGCIGLTSINIPNSVTSIGLTALRDCTGLTSVTIPQTVTSIGGGVFSGCSSLTTLKVEAGNPVYDSRDNSNAIIETATNTLIAVCQATNIPNSVTSIGVYAFSGCKWLSSITLPNSVTSIGAAAFMNCTGLVSVIIPNSVTFIDHSVFQGCTSLTSIVIPNGVPSIGESTFSFCTSLASITIPNTVLSLGRWSFCNCTSLASITIGNGIISIGNEAFNGCKKLSEVICLAENVQTASLSAFFAVPIQNATLKVPENSIDLYKSQKPWCDFGEIVVYSPDNEAANSVIAKIKAIGKVVYTDVSKARIDAARKAYEALTDVQKALVTNVANLIAAEAKYLELQELATGINVVSVDNAENIWYDLSGRQLSKKPVTKGVYIQNGKTVLIK